MPRLRSRAGIEGAQGQDFLPYSGDFDPDLLTYWQYENSDADSILGISAPWQNGTPEYVDAVFGKGAAMDNSPANNYMLASASVATVGDTPDFTWTLWSYHDSSTNGTWNYARIKSPADYDILLVVNSVSNFVRARVFESNVAYLGSEAAIGGDIRNTWSFWAIAHEDATDTAYLYKGLNGASLVQLQLTAAGGYVGPRRRAADEIRMGWLPVERTIFDDFRYYGVYKNSASVDAIYAEGKAALGL